MLPTKMTDQSDMEAVLKDTIVLLCQNGLRFQSELNVEALVAITVDQSQVLLVSIKETIHANNAAQCSDVLTVDEEESSLDTTVNPVFSCNTSTGAEKERDVDICHGQEPVNSRDMLDGVTGRLAENNEDSHELIEQTPGIGLKPNTSISENCVSDKLVSASLAASASHADEALDLTGHGRKLTSPTTKRKRYISNSVDTSTEFQLDESGATVSVEDADNSNELNSVVFIKDEIPASADVDTDWSLCFSTPVPRERNCLSKRSWHKACSSAANPDASLLMEDAMYTALPHSDQAATDVDVHAVCQAILAYSGWCVPLRDIQRLRLRGLPSAVIRTAMETLEQTGVGRCCEVTGNMCVFYKCPPHLITAESLTRWQLTWNDYSVQFMSLPSLNQTNRHNESYWQRVASSSPYSCV